MHLLLKVIFVCALIFHSKAQDDEITKEKAQEFAMSCKEEVGATDADVDAIFKHEPLSSSEGKCLRACLMQKLKILDEDGKLNKEEALNLVKIMAKGDADKEKAGEEIVEACAGIDVDENHCEAAEQYSACYKEQAEEKSSTSLEI